MTKKTLQELTREIHFAAKDEQALTKVEIELGCLLRIAEVLEVMNIPVERLKEQIEALKEARLRLADELEHQKSRIAGFKAEITKLKAKLAAK